MKITILTDNRDSWFVPYGHELFTILNSEGFDVSYVHDKTEILNGDICFLLSCSRLVENEFLERNAHNIVVHASDLPLGKGFSPLQWQILEGYSEITLTLFEVVEKADSGPYYLKDKIRFNGFELLDELRKMMAEKIIDMCLYFVKNIDTLQPVHQQGDESFYPRRHAKDDFLDIEKSISQNFNHLRIADNDRFPVKIEIGGHKYILKVYRDDS